MLSNIRNFSTEMGKYGVVSGTDDLNLVVSADCQFLIFSELFLTWFSY